MRIFKMLKEIKQGWNKFMGKKQKIEAPDVRAIVKVNEVAKARGIYDDSNKIIEIYKYGHLKTIKYSDADVESLREQGVPVVEESYTDENEWIESASGGTVDHIR
jgi:hypothetical protein